MSAVIWFVVEIGSIVALVWLVVRLGHLGFRSSTRKAGAVQLAAAGSALITLLSMVAIYADVTRHDLLSGGEAVFGQGSMNGLRPGVVDIDRGIRSATNVVNPGRSIVYNAHPPLWPVLLVAVAYAIQFVIVAATRRRRLTATAITGRSYWSHISGYVAAVAFLVVVAHWSWWLVVGGSIVLSGVVFLGIFVTEDFAVLAQVGLRWCMRFARGIAKEVAAIAGAFARQVRVVLESAQRLYLDNVRRPVRAAADRALAASEEFERAADRHLDEEEMRNRQAFHDEDAPDAPARFN